MPRLAARVALLVIVCWSSIALAQIARVQPPARKSLGAARAAKVKRARAQGLKPAQVAAIARAMDSRAAQLGEAGLGDPRLRSSLATAPLRARLEVFVKAAGRRGVTVQTFERRLRGMIKNGKRYRVSSPMKQFFEVTPETFDLFPQIMGENVVWFASSPSPAHLHTLLSDQNGGPNFSHNTYGDSTTEYRDAPGGGGESVRLRQIGRAEIGNEQYIAPAQLTGPEMDRFVRYLNAAVAADAKTSVYGFRSSSGEEVLVTKCTNWATSAPIGEVKRWIRTVDKRVARASKAGLLPKKFGGGLHAALAAAPTAAARAKLIAEVSAVDSLGAQTRSQVRRLGKEFDYVAEKWPDRPRDLVGRESLSEVLGLARSQDPAKWMYDLVMSKRVPVIGVLNKARQENFAAKTFDLEIMGTIDVSGDVVPGTPPSYDSRATYDRGVVPADRRRPTQP